ncbi:Spermidine synthase [Halanaeroarchaeum sp. HSR-CO]|uniref:spermidine synthase n=1 Tax=Halanaeroarchaeum sp. HSR-CO TaxID=2866382 RepID=UPI00217D9BE7|nr:fused MFS/spermidine synthase [Halanaeroarchaeum sp. HSR-CO]UWG48804.1 Spermidine synthase [Halanaeroarchaeum sp. HSR-CO]
MQSNADTARFSVPIQTAEGAVLVSGFSSMGLEILAGRIIAPEFGSSIYTWGSIIGVFLVALSLGYWYGGKRAAAKASPLALAGILAQSALFVAFLLAAGDLLLQFTDTLPLPNRYAVILPIAVLFGPPVYLLGFISPYAAQLSREQSTGGASGRVYALGTIGSIAGTFGTTFVLIPSLSVPIIELFFGVLLVGAAAVIVLRRAPRSLEMVRVVVIASLVVGAFAFGGASISTGDSIVYQTQTPYQQLEVADDDGVRTLYLDGTPHSATYVDDREGYVFEYLRYLHIPMLVQDDVDNVLFIGGGGFTAPQRFVEEYPDVNVDVVEIDPVVIQTAEDYFGLAESDRLQVHEGDGRAFLDETDTEYDVIVLDAYKSDQVPFHLTTVEFMHLAADRLDEDGMLVANIISRPSGSGSAFFRAEYKTMKEAFPYVYAFPTSETVFLQNIEVVASKQQLTRGQLQTRAEERDVGVPLETAVSRMMDSDTIRTDDVPVLRDDKAPVDELLDSQLDRRYVVSETNETASVAR